MKMIIKLLLGLLLMSSLLLVSCQTLPENTETINVAGHADMPVAPDRAMVYVGISVLRLTAAEAQAEADKVIIAIIDGLRYKGITESDIQTEHLNLYEEKSWENNTQVSKGWRATQTLKIKTNDLTKVGEVVDIAVKSGANQINSIEFYLSASKVDESKQLVLAKATQNAKKKAQTIADNLEVTLDNIISVSESNYGYTPYMYTLANNRGAEAVQESVKVMPSDVMVSADIALVYAIKQE